MFILSLLSLCFIPFVTNADEHHDAWTDEERAEIWNSYQVPFSSYHNRIILTDQSQTISINVVDPHQRQYTIKLPITATTSYLKSKIKESFPAYASSRFDLWTKIETSTNKILADEGISANSIIYLDLLPPRDASSRLENVAESLNVRRFPMQIMIDYSYINVPLKMEEVYQKLTTDCGVGKDFAEAEYKLLYRYPQNGQQGTDKIDEAKLNQITGENIIYFQQEARVANNWERRMFDIWVVTEGFGVKKRRDDVFDITFKKACQLIYKGADAGYDKSKGKRKAENVIEVNLYTDSYLSFREINYEYDHRDQVYEIIKVNFEY